MSTQLELANIALIKCGAATIANMTDPSNIAKTISALYPFVRKHVLIHGIWNFATKNVSPSKMPTCSNPDYAFEYQLPSDCIKVQRLNTTIDERFCVEADKLFCNIDAVSIKYTTDVTNEGYFSIEFEEAFTHKLAADACFRLTQNQAKADKLLAEYENIVLPRSRMNDSQERNGDEFTADAFTEVRL